MKNNLYGFFIFVGLAVSLSACTVALNDYVSQKSTVSNSQLSAARAAISRDLFDPYSADFRDEAIYKLSNGEYLYCVNVNAKNRMGGFVGFQKYHTWFYLSDGRVIVKNTRVYIPGTAAGYGCLGAQNNLIRLDVNP